MRLFRTLLSLFILLLDALARRLRILPPIEAPMLATEVQRIWTPIVYEDLRIALAAAHEAHFAYALWPTALPVVMGMMRLEHGPLQNGLLHGCAGWNLGNFDATLDELGDRGVKVFRTVPEHEVIGGASALQSHLRVASADVDAGAERWWRVMATGRFSGAVDVLHGSGLPDDASVKQVADAYCEALKSAGYFTASLVSYEHAVEQFAAMA